MDETSIEYFYYSYKLSLEDIAREFGLKGGWEVNLKINKFLLKKLEEKFPSSQWRDLDLEVLNPGEKYLISKQIDKRNRSLKWQAENKDKQNERGRTWRKQKYNSDPSFKAKCLEKGKQWRAENKDQVNDWRKSWFNNNPNKKLADRIRSRIRAALKSSRIKKRENSESLIGCSFSELRVWIEEQWQSGMSWDNYGHWHVDHIIPCAAYDLNDQVEQNKCFNYRNLRPLWAEDNIVKHDNFGVKELEGMPKELWPKDILE